MPRSLLNADELEILTALWERGPLKPSDIQGHLSYPIKNSALRWQLGELVEQGWLTRHREGKAFVYAAAQPRRSVFASLANRLKDLLFGGSAIAMIGEMIDAGGLSPEELRQLSAIAKGRTEPARKPDFAKKEKTRKPK